MAARKKALDAANPYVGSGDPDDLGPMQRLAHDILIDRGDLLPSVDRIMQAGLAEDETVQALTLFQGALATPGDPHRDPRLAIAAATGGATPAPAAP